MAAPKSPTVGRTLRLAGALAESMRSLGNAIRWADGLNRRLQSRRAFANQSKCLMKRVAILLFLVASGLHGQEAPTITIRKGETTNVAPARRLAEAMVPLRRRCLQNDLDLSGWFSLTPPERASYIIERIVRRRHDSRTGDRSAWKRRSAEDVFWWSADGGTSIRG